MKCVLIVGPERMVVGPFDCDDDAIGYALNVLDSDSFVVQPLQSAASVQNVQLLERMA